jgi:hypothetical protein
MFNKSTYWAVLNPSGGVVRWVGARSTRREAISVAVEGCMSADDYWRLGNDSARWQHAYRRGYRVIRVNLVEPRP